MKFDLFKWAFLCLAAGSSLQASLVTSASCSATSAVGQPGLSQTDPAACSVGYTNPGSGGQANGSISHRLITSSYIDDGFSVLTAASAPAGAHSSAVVHGISDLTFYSTGPVRQGQVQFNLLVVGQSLYGAALSANVSIAGLQSTCNQIVNGQLTCTGALGTGSLASYTTDPFTLGQSFVVHEDVSADSEGSAGANQVGNVQFDFFFRLFNADGSPVQVFPAADAPEPGTWMLLAAGAGIVLTLKRRKLPRH